jgi:hypothetical protein
VNLQTTQKSNVNKPKLRERKTFSPKNKTKRENDINGVVKTFPRDSQAPKSICRKHQQVSGA